MCGGRVINWQLQHTSRRISPARSVELVRERSLAYRERYLWHIGKKSDILYSRRSDILISSWRASPISIKLTKIRPEKEKAECISIGGPWLYFPKNILAAGSIYRSPRAGNDPRKFVIIPPPLIRRITCKKHNEQEFSQFRCVQSINPGFLPSGQIINLSEYKKWEYVRGSHRLWLDGHLVTGFA